MMYWAAILFASLSWMFGVKHFVEPDAMRQWALIGAALVCGTVAVRRSAGDVRLSRKYLLLLAPIGLTIAMAQDVFRPGLYVLAAGVVLLVVGGAARSAWLGFVRQVGLAGALLGTVLVAQGPIFWMIGAWTARNPQVPYVASVVYYILTWVGADVSHSHHTLYLRMMREVHAVSVTWNHLAVYPMTLLWLAGSLLVWWDRGGRPVMVRWAKLTATLIGYAVFRFAIVVALFMTAMLFVEYGEDKVWVELFWLPSVTAVTLLPLVPVLARFVPWGSAGPLIAGPIGVWDRRRQRVAVVGMAAAACAVLTTGNYFWESGVAKPGRVLIDEAHSKWERTDRAYTTDWYGNESGYNYYCMAQYLNHYYDVEFNMNEPLTPERLAQCDVLILKTPTSPFSDDEIDAIEQFVEDGGGLFAFGEHTNVFGSSACLNPVTRRFGIGFEYDIALDIDRKWEQIAFPRTIGVDPITKEMPFFRFAVSATIIADSWRARPLIRSGGLWTLPIEYASGNFYPQVEDKTYARFGAFDQLVSSTFGRGRVVCFADSTVYSNFLAFYPGKPEVLLGAVEWLNRESRMPWLDTGAAAVFLVLVAAVLVMARRLRPNLGWSAVTVATAVATVWIVMWACGAHARAAYPAPKPHTPYTNIVFDLESGDYVLPVFGFVGVNDYRDSYSVFYQWVLRLGHFTRIALEGADFDLDAALAGDDPIVMIRPVKPFEAARRSAVRAFLERGGSLLVLDSAANSDSTANTLLGEFDMAVANRPCSGQMIVEPTSGARICTVTQAAPVEGGTPLLRTNADEVVLASRRVGKGELIVGGVADRFTDMQMGVTWRVVPDATLRKVYELAFTLFRGLADGDMAGQVRSMGAIYGAQAVAAN